MSAPERRWRVVSLATSGSTRRRSAPGRHGPALNLGPRPRNEINHRGPRASPWRGHPGTSTARPWPSASSSLVSAMPSVAAMAGRRPAWEPSGRVGEGHSEMASARAEEDKSQGGPGWPSGARREAFADPLLHGRDEPGGDTPVRTRRHSPPWGGRVHVGSSRRRGARRESGSSQHPRHNRSGGAPKCVAAQHLGRCALSWTGACGRRRAVARGIQSEGRVPREWDAGMVTETLRHRGTVVEDGVVVKNGHPDRDPARCWRMSMRVRTAAVRKRANVSNHSGPGAAPSRPRSAGGR